MIVHSINEMFEDIIKQMNKLMNNSDKIIKFLREKTVITSSELAKFLGISWNTAEKYLLELAVEGKVLKLKKEKVNLWMIK
jgi:predicted HTH transcriptional regulator